LQNKIYGTIQFSHSNRETTVWKAERKRTYFGPSRSWCDPFFWSSFVLPVSDVFSVLLESEWKMREDI
jgi:hypothetical protein